MTPFTQVLTIAGIAIACIGGAVAIVRHLISNAVEKKNATIELLKEKNIWFEKQLDLALSKSPDKLLDIKHKRIEMLEGEITRLAEQDTKNQTAIHMRQSEANLLSEDIEALKQLIEGLKDKASQANVCPECNAPLVSMADYDPGEEYHCIITHEAYACGYSTSDGSPQTPCTNKKQKPKTGLAENRAQ